MYCSGHNEAHFKGDEGLFIFCSQSTLMCVIETVDKKKQLFIYSKARIRFQGHKETSLQSKGVSIKLLQPLVIKKAILCFVIIKCCF